MRLLPPKPRLSDVLACLAIAIVVAFVGVFVAQMTGFPNALDEMRHYSYIAFIAETGNLGPALHEIPNLGPAPFYLNHPPGYYALMAPAFHACGGDAACLRLANVPLGVLTALLFYAALRRAGGRWPAALAGTLGLLLVPFIAFMPGWISNDNLGFLAGAVTVFGLSGLAGPYGRAHWPLVAIGLVLAGLTKANLLLGLALVAGLAFAVRALQERGVALRPIAWLTTAAAVAAAPYLAFMRTYGAPVPDTRELQGVERTVEAGRRASDDGEFAWFFINRLGESLLDPFLIAAGGGIGALITLSVFLLPFVAAWRVRSSAGRALFIAVGCAGLVQLAVHAAHIWGYLGAAHMRYYQPFVLFAILAIFASLRWTGPPARTR